MDNNPQNVYGPSQPNMAPQQPSPIPQPPQLQPQNSHNHKKLIVGLTVALVSIAIAAAILAVLLITKKDNSKEVADEVVKKLNEPFEPTEETVQESNDVERKTDINALHGQLEAYQAQYAFYPTLSDINSASWRSENMKGLDDESLKDPKGTETRLGSSPTANSYFYEPSPSGCDNADGGQCTSYTLTASLETGGTYVKQSLN